ncbi:MAG: hypothetical protein IKM15_04555 [Peptococcaceae bacterium]|nr:hypothetical protein [Peptococcaceae bacterium]
MQNHIHRFFANLPYREQIAFEEEISNDAELNLKQLIAHHKPTAENLYPHEILFLFYASDYQVTQTDFPKFWQTLFGIYYPEEILQKLFDEDFLEINKETYFYNLTEKGSQTLDKYQYIPFVHQHPFCNIGIWTMHKLVQETPEKDYLSIIYERYQQFCRSYLKSHNYIGYRNTLVQMSQFTELCGRTEETARILPLVSYLNLYLENDVDENTLTEIKNLSRQFLLSP